VDTAELMEQRKRMAMMGALAGGALTFLFVGIFDELIKIGAGAILGAVIGVIAWARSLRHRRGQQAVDLTVRTRADLEQEARRLGIEGRSAMNKEELAAAIAARRQAGLVDPSGELLVETLDVVSTKFDRTVGRLGDKVRKMTTLSSHPS
jgi:hypothetical protein